MVDREKLEERAHGVSAGHLAPAKAM